MSGPPGKEKGALQHAPIPKLFEQHHHRKSAKQVNETYGPAELCSWQIAPGVFWIQTTEPAFSRKLGKRADTRRVGIVGVRHFRRTFELRGTWRKIRRVIDRYLVSAPDMFSGLLRPASASKNAGSIMTAAAGRDRIGREYVREDI